LKKFIQYSVLSLPFLVLNAQATNGYFQHGYGVKSQGMGGIGIALPQDSIAAAINPAGMGLIGNRYDMGVNLFKPERNAEIQGGANDGNDSSLFLIPEFGYNKVLNDQYTVGLSVYANGGMNTNYKDGIALFDSGRSRAGIDLTQLFIAPSLTFKPDPKHSLGVAINFAIQSFEAKGLQNFKSPSFTSSPNNVTNNGDEYSYGAGIKLGWIGKITDKLSLGATYHSKTYMTKLDDYKGLFAEGGDFDIPSHYGFGLAYEATPELTIAFDYEKIEYSGVRSVNNPLLPNLTSSKLGNSGGAGFGWRDVDVLKIGFNYQWSDNLTLRAGFNHNSQPIPRSETFFNVLAPGVIRNHLSLGFTWNVTDDSELSLAYTHAFREKVKGSGSIPSSFGGGEADLEMYQNSLGVAYGVNF
jgi:long-chain fatty acid transport protein